MRTAERRAHNEATFRDANEAIEERRKAYGIRGQVPFLCECEEESCTELVRLSPAEYRAVRVAPEQFFIAPGHLSEGGKIVERHDRYFVVEKTGRDAEVARKRADR